jgi:hypothetical protein
MSWGAELLPTRYSAGNAFNNQVVDSVHQYCNTSVDALATGSTDRKCALCKSEDTSGSCPTHHSTDMVSSSTGRSAQPVDITIVLIGNNDRSNGGHVAHHDGLHVTMAPCMLMLHLCEQLNASNTLRNQLSAK